MIVSKDIAWMDSSTLVSVAGVNSGRRQVASQTLGDDVDHGRVEQSLVQPLQVGGQIGQMMTLPPNPRLIGAALRHYAG
jgi:hypothetical protein